MLLYDMVSPRPVIPTHNSFTSGKQEWYDHEAQSLTGLAGMQGPARFLYREAMIHCSGIHTSGALRFLE